LLFYLLSKKIGKLKVPDSLLGEIQNHRFTSLSINLDHVQLAEKLPAIHKDLFDRMLISQALISQAMIEKLIIVTRDKLIAEYNVPILKA